MSTQPTMFPWTEPNSESPPPARYPIVPVADLQTWAKRVGEQLAERAKAKESDDGD